MCICLKSIFHISRKESNCKNWYISEFGQNLIFVTETRELGHTVSSEI